MIKKLTRIWVPEGIPREKIDIRMDGTSHRQFLEKLRAEQEAHMAQRFSDMGLPYKGDKRTRQEKKDHSSCLEFRVDRGDGTYFTYYERDNWWDLCSTDAFPSDEKEPGYKFYGYMGLLRIWDDDELGEFFDAGRGFDPAQPYSSARRAEFSQRWLPLFRRNCWLCGCDIECSRKERQEWIQGLTEQEIHDWQLDV